MWSYEFFGYSVYQLIACFCLYSMGGWLVESVYMSICERKIVNRGFGATPFCPIYGFGALAGYLALRPIAEYPIAVYFAGAVVATVFEFIVAKLMMKFLHEVWWNYMEKPVNVQGLICLESTLAWGLYAILVVRFLHGGVIGLIERIPILSGQIAVLVILGIYAVDFVYHVMRVVRKSRWQDQGGKQAA